MSNPEILRYDGVAFDVASEKSSRVLHIQWLVTQCGKGWRSIKVFVVCLFNHTVLTLIRV